MRTEAVIKNTSIAFIANIVLALIKLILRKVFLMYFDVSLIGYEGLFTSIFTVLSIAEMGSSSIFGFMLYKAVAENNCEDQSLVMSMYKQLYIFIGIFVFCIAIIILFLLNNFISYDNYNAFYVKFIYIIQLMNILCTYFLSYKRSLLYANQKSYIVVYYSALCDILGCILRIISIIVFKSFIFYSIVPLFTSILANKLIINYCNKNYPEIVEKKVSISDYKDHGVFKQLKAIFVSKISTVLYTTSDSILISAMIGIKYMGLYSNYLQFVGMGKTLLGHFSEPLGHSIGNLVYSEDQEKRTNMYRCIDLLGTYIGILSFTVGTSIFQRVIILVFGNQFLLSDWVVVATTLDFYVRCRGLAYNAFRGTVGHYEETQFIDLIAAFSNILFSILFAYRFGLEGILFATIIGNVLIQTGRAMITFKYSVKVSVFKEIMKEVYYLLVTAIIYILVAIICRSFKYNFLGLIESLIASIAVTIILGFIFTFKIFVRTSFLDYIIVIKSVIANKFVRN